MSNDLKSSQFAPLEIITGNEEFGVWINEQNFRVKISQLQMQGSNIDATILASKADQTAVDTLSTTVTALSTTVASKADQLTVDTLSTSFTALSTTVASKADQSTVDTLSTTVTALSTTVASKADQSTVDTLSTTVASKADQTAVDTLSTTVTDLSTTVATKLNEADVALLIRQSTRPIINATVNNQTAVTADITVVYTTCNGYDMANVINKLHYRVTGDTVWIDAPDVAFVTGQLSYIFNLTGLIATTNYEYEVYLSDVNNPTLDIVSAGTFLTTA